MKVKNLASSSEGNCTNIYTDSASILIDSGGRGFSAKHVLEKMGEYNAPQPEAIFITHEHGDHMGGAGVLGRKTKAKIYMHKDSYEKFEHDEWFEKTAFDKEAFDVKRRKAKFIDCNLEFLDLTDTYEIGDLRITPFSTPHDSVYSVGYVIEDTTNKKKLGYLTDCGSFTKVMEVALKGCDAYLIEADYDEDMLNAYEEYDDLLKDRIRSPIGHLSNKQTLDFLEKIGIDKTEFVMFCHLSTRTNDPDLLLKQANERFPSYGKFYIAPNEKAFEL